jgi:tetratricopeptide (TPR) repeat protein
VSIRRPDATLGRRSAKRTIAFLRIAALAAVSAMIVSARLASAEDLPLLEQDPYDIIRVAPSSTGGEATDIKVEPLKFPDGKIPQSPKPTDKLEVKLADEPDQVRSIEWRYIEKITLFEDQVLAKASELVAAQKLDDAFDYYKYLFERYPRAANLPAGYENYLYEEAKYSHRNQRYDEALAVLRQIYATNPKRTGLDKAMGLATEKLVEQYAAQNRNRAANALVRELGKAYPGHPVATAWTERIGKQAEVYLGEGRTAAEKGDWVKAAEQSRLLTALAPGLQGAKELAQQIHEKHPQIVVGVMSRSAAGGENTLADWPLRRDRRLFYRTLTEYLGPGMEGGQYLCPVGKCSLAAESLGRRLVFQIKPDIRWADSDVSLTPYDVARRLVALSDPADRAFCEDWAELMQGVAVAGSTDVEVELRRLHVRPEALLQTLLVPYTVAYSPNGPAPTNGPFMLPRAVAAKAEAPAAGSPAKTDGAKSSIPPTSSNFTETVYGDNPQYFAAKPTQPKVLVERHYSSGDNAIQALKRGDIQLLDRIGPWNLPQIKGDPKLAVGKYNVPLVHCLVPNFSRPLPSRRTLRRALAYGMDRKAILEQIVGKEPIEGCRLISGPFSAGVSTDDPVNYAYDERIEPRPCDPRMAIALSRLALKQFQKSEKEQGREVKKLPPLVLAYPDDEIAALACRSIKYQLGWVHIEVELKPLIGPMPNRVPDDVDLLYAELAMGEPVTDAGRLFGEGCLAGGGSPFVALAVKQLERDTDWASIREQLRRLHRIVFDDVTVVPRWQLVDFYAYRKGNRGIGDKPFTIYQNIEQWQPAFNYPDGE